MSLPIQDEGAKSALDLALSSKEPIKALLKRAEGFIRDKNTEGLHEIDVVLNDRFIHFIRMGTMSQLNHFKISMLAFTDSPHGNRLKRWEPGRSYYYRWRHFHDLCDIAAENYDTQMVKRFVESKKHGKELLRFLYENIDGIRHRTLAEMLNISRQNLNKLILAFEAHNLITRERGTKHTVVKLDLHGRAFMEELEPPATTPGPPAEPQHRYKLDRTGTDVLMDRHHGPDFKEQMDDMIRPTKTEAPEGGKCR